MGELVEDANILQDLEPVAPDTDADPQLEQLRAALVKPHAPTSLGERGPEREIGDHRTSALNSSLFSHSVSKSLSVIFLLRSPGKLRWECCARSRKCTA